VAVAALRQRRVLEGLAVAAQAAQDKAVLQPLAHQIPVVAAVAVAILNLETCQKAALVVLGS